MSLPVAVAIWAAVVLLAAFAGLHLGYSGARFAIALGVAAALFAFEFFLAAPKVFSTVQGALGQRRGCGGAGAAFRGADLFHRSWWQLEVHTDRRSIRGAAELLLAASSRTFRRYVRGLRCCGDGLVTR